MLTDCISMVVRDNGAIHVSFVEIRGGIPGIVGFLEEPFNSWAELLSEIPSEYLNVPQWRVQAEANIVFTERVKIEKVKRNDPCPCGSGKKYKKCHGLAH